MSSSRHTRRRFLEISGAATAAACIVGGAPGTIAELRAQEANDRPVLGCIGTGSRWGAVGPAAMQFSDCVAVCDVDANHAAGAKAKVSGIQAKKGSDREVAVYDDYRKILEREDIDVVTIVTPDHWHTKICIEAMQAGKHVYCEKPLTLTIEEGQLICKVAKETGVTFQVGTQQRSEMGLRFLTALALVREGRIGEVQKVQCAIGGSSNSGPLKTEAVPAHLNWDMWLGQAPLVDYIPRRCHYEFRWWYEYSGGKMTDWGAHHVDIAQWAIAQDDTGPTSVEGTATHPVPFKDGYPTQDNAYNAATAFNVKCVFPNGVEMTIRHDTENGILFTGSEGELFVSRGALRGPAVDALRDNPLPEDAITKLYRGKKPGNHMANFFECIKTGDLPISDVFTHHRSMTTCHLANIAIRLGRGLRWDPKSEQMVGDEEAAGWVRREQRAGYEINV